MTEYAFFWEIFGGKSYEAADIAVVSSSSQATSAIRIARMTPKECTLCN